MPVISCKKCGADVSDEDDFCPNCHTLVSSGSLRNRRTRRIVFVVALAVTVVFSVSDLFSDQISFAIGTIAFTVLSVAVPILLLMALVAATYFHKRKQVSHRDPRLVTFREVVADWIRPWKQLPKDAKIAFLLVCAMISVVYLSTYYHLIQQDSWLGVLGIFLMTLICLYFVAKVTPILASWHLTKNVCSLKKT
jgi:predicted nucleic acid-binding Zn ribbon protein